MLRLLKYRIAAASIAVAAVACLISGCSAGADPQNAGGFIAQAGRIISQGFLMPQRAAAYLLGLNGSRSAAAGRMLLDAALPGCSSPGANDADTQTQMAALPTNTPGNAIQASEPAAQPQAATTAAAFQWSQTVAGSGAPAVDYTNTDAAIVTSLTANGNVDGATVTPAQIAADDPKLGFKTPVTDIDSIPASERADIVPEDMSRQTGTPLQILLENQTSYKIDIPSILAMPYPIQQAQYAGPLVLVVHTHGTESFTPAGHTQYYPPFTAERTTDPANNVLAVGDAFTKQLEACGVPAIHCEIEHDSVSYNNAYYYSSQTVARYLQEYPTIRYVFDIHRDSVIAADGTKYKTYYDADGTPAAQVMLVVGTDAAGLADPNWRQNLAVATQFQRQMNALFPKLARPIDIRTERFNEQLSTGYLLLEIGSCGNTVAEAQDAARMCAQCVAEVINN